MDGIHDLGGMHGFGRVEVEPDEPPFHESWEGRLHGVRLASGIAIGRGSLRPDIERMGNAEYLATSYYEHWLTATEAWLVRAGVITEEELAARQAAVAAGEAEVGERQDPDSAAFVRSLFRPFPSEERSGPAPRFAVGDRVQVRRMHPQGHTRCPRYVRGAPGVIALVHGPQPLPDRRGDRDASGNPVVEPFYTVAFSPQALWGEDAEPGAATIRVDLWESYLEGGPG